MQRAFSNLDNEMEFQRCLERLIDGELSETAEREIISAIERRPNGWRRCALAFLESQALRQSLLDSTDDQPRTSTEVIVPCRANTRWLIKIVKPLWVAVALLFAFTLGAVLRDWWNPGALQLNVPRLANVGSTKEEPDAARSWQAMKVTIPSADGQSEQTVEVPLVKADKETLEALLADQEPVLSDIVVKTLEQTGHRVDQHRTYYPVTLDDGRSAVLPMDVVEVEYTGGWQ